MGSGDSSEDAARLHGELVRAVRGVCPRRYADRADDLVQKAMVKLLKRREQGEGPARPNASYLRRVAYNALVDELRLPQRRHEEPMSTSTVAFGDPAPNPEQQSKGTQLRLAIRRCLERLVASRRTAVSMALIGHSVPETAQLLGWGRKKTENLVLRGRRDLRRCLEEAGWTP